MVVRTPYVIQANSHDAETFRRALKANWTAQGVLTSAALAVTAQGTPNMTVNVAAGEAIIFGTQQTEQGAYHVYNDATVVMPAHDASDPTNPRNDLIVYKVEDAEYSGSVNASSLAIVKGTPAATPVDPATPANAIVLARVRVGAAATTVTSANITNLRTLATSQPWNAPRGAVAHTCTNTSTTVTTITFTSVANRKYLISFSAQLNGVTTANAYMAVTGSAGTLNYGIGATSAGTTYSISPIFPFTASTAATVTLTFTVTNTTFLKPDATNQLVGAVQDIGPSTTI